MTKRTVWYVALVVLCCCALAFVAVAAKPAPASNVPKTKTVPTVGLKETTVPVTDTKLENYLKTQANKSEALQPAVSPSTGVTSEPVPQSAIERELAARAYESWLTNGTATASDKALMERNNVFGSENMHGNPLDAQGGPDAYGYRWVDNQGGDTATYSWIELCNDASASIGPTGDDAAASINLGLTFPYYGSTYTTAYLSTNGVLSFSGSNSLYSNSCISATNTNNAIYIFWDDMVYAAGTPGTCTNDVIYYRSFGTYLVIEYHIGTMYSGGSVVDVEAILYTNGQVKIQWNTAQNLNDGASATVALEAAGANGVQYSCNTAFAPSGKAVTFYPPAQDPTGRCCYGPNYPCTPITCVVNTATQCAALGGNWTVGIDCNTACPQGPTLPGELCCNAIVIPSFPYSNTGSTAGYANDYAPTCMGVYGTGRDVVYTFTITANTTVLIDLTGTGSYGYPGVGLFQGCPNTGTCVAWAGISNGDLHIPCTPLTPGTYYILVDNWPSPDFIPYTLSVGQCADIARCCYGDPFNPTCANNSASDCATLGGQWNGTLDCNTPCPLPCAGALTCPPNAIQEGEGCVAPNPDNFNGGCNSTPNVFSPIACGQTVCGASTSDGSYRDTDWYTVTVTGPTLVNWTVNASFASSFLIGTLNGVCPATAFRQFASGPSCTQLTVVDTFPAAGTYYLFVAQADWTVMTCGVYVASLTCSPFTWPIGRCCYNGGTNCADNTPPECTALAGTWTANETCAGNPCPLERPCATMTPADANLDPVPSTPWAGSVAGNCGNFGKWDGSFTATAGLVYHFDLCPDAPGAGSGNFDADIKICDAAGTIYAGVDGYCPSGINIFLPNDFQWTPAVSGTYYAVIAPYYSYPIHACNGTSANTFTMQYYVETPTLGRCCYGDPVTPTCSMVGQSACTSLGGVWDQNLNCTDNPCPTCDVTQPQGATLEGEPVCADEYVDNYNGGCNSTPNVFEPIACGQTYFGTSGTFLFAGGQYRDTDWYTHTFDQANTATWTVTAEFPLLIFILHTTDCVNYDVLLSTTAAACQTATLTSPVNAGGTYYFWVGPSVFTGVPCGREYVATLTTDIACTCDPVTDLVVHRGAGLANDVVLTWTGSQSFGNYKLYSTTVKNNDGDPNYGADPDWTLLTTIPAPAVPGPLTYTDSPLVPYVNYVVEHDCTPHGRCCYGNPTNPSCASPVTQAYCTQLAGTWTVNETCQANPCPIVVGADACANATLVTAGSYSWTNVGATTDGVWTCGLGANDVWIKYVATSANPITATTCNFPGFDTVIEALDACGGNNLGCNDDASCSPVATESSITWTPVSGNTYYIGLAGFNGGTGSATVTITQ